jgi:hypothetical protein
VALQLCLWSDRENEMAKSRHNTWKYALPLVFNFLDAVLTLVGQPSIYWQDHTKTLEMAPQFSFLLKIGPTAFLIGMCVWALLWCLLIRLTPPWVSLLTALTYCMGHAFGAFTWLLYRYEINYFFLFVYFPALAFSVLLMVKNEKRPNKVSDRKIAHHP